MFKKIISWLLVIGCAGLIFYFSAQPVNVSRSQSNTITTNVQNIVTKVSGKDSKQVKKLFKDHYIRKFGHMSLFFLFGFLLMNLFGTINMKRMYAAALIAVLTYAITDELHQIIVPGRGPLISDVFIDFIGGSIGVISFGILRKLKTVFAK